ncbi:MAG TPA: DUF4388 domain-containing protein [Pyrinomonadaceae bacterium]|nr:DUF4388 domain-containing protein [Pyrinomonadaceae bacterium]
MENVERTQFVVLAGHLDEQPLPDLIRRLRVQRKTGRLQVEYAEGPGSFFFEEGQLVDAQLGKLRGVEALYAALSLGGASFNFNPLVRPPERSIDRQGQRFVEDLVEGPRREGLAELRVAGREVNDAAPLPPRADLLQLPPAAGLVAPLEERLTAVEEAINNTARRFSRERLAYAVVISFLAGLSLVATLGAIFYPSGPARTPPAGAALTTQAPQQTAPSRPEPQPKQEPAAGRDAPDVVPSAASVIGTRKVEGVSAPRGAYVVQVIVQVEQGRVTDARVWNPRPGADAHESIALRMARERRYPEQFTGSERLRIKVQP